MIDISPENVTSSYGLIKRLRELKSTDHQYIAVRNYVQNKMEKGRDVDLIEDKLRGIEEKCKVYGHIQDKTGDAFVRVRSEYHLKPSAYFRGRAGADADAERQRRAAPVARVASNTPGGAPPPYIHHESYEPVTYEFVPAGAGGYPVQAVYAASSPVDSGPGSPLGAASPPAPSSPSPIQTPPVVAPAAPSPVPIPKRESMPGLPSSLLPSPTRAYTLPEDPLSRLADFNTIFLVDDSTAMTPARWEQARQAVTSVVEKVKPHAAVDIAFLNNETTGDGLASTEAVEGLFEAVQPQAQGSSSTTTTGKRIGAMLAAYMTALESNPETKALNLIVLSGWEAPTDDIKESLAATARQLDEGGFPVSRVNVQLVQIGNDLEAVMALMRFEQALGERYTFMVDTNTYDPKEGAGDKTLRILLRRVGRGRR
ncbi:uncharacterized protein LOC62_05G007140 [Vanrija pseudolonga]|uniref:VWFA domain-containing protein n=1 Tax=Vanrija pseudolonga TaxID=143232 RepID=A0AAF0YBG8_9TREE|nr:hypothetical protein LOC62_05G007140 [Vanrija pseudolonga]